MTIDASDVPLSLANPPPDPSLTLQAMSIEDPVASKIAHQLALSAAGLDIEQMATDIRCGKWYLVSGAIVAATNSAMVDDSRMIDRLRGQVDRLTSLVTAMSAERDERVAKRVEGGLSSAIDKLIESGVLVRRGG